MTGFRAAFNAFAFAYASAHARTLVPTLPLQPGERASDFARRIEPLSDRDIEELLAADNLRRQP